MERLYDAVGEELYQDVKEVIREPGHDILPHWRGLLLAADLLPDRESCLCTDGLPRNGSGGSRRWGGGLSDGVVSSPGGCG